MACTSTTFTPTSSSSPDVALRVAYANGLQYISYGEYPRLSTASGWWIEPQIGEYACAAALAPLLYMGKYASAIGIAYFVFVISYLRCSSGCGRWFSPLGRCSYAGTCSGSYRFLRVRSQWDAFHALFGRSRRCSGSAALPWTCLSVIWRKGKAVVLRHRRS